MNCLWLRSVQAWNSEQTTRLQEGAAIFPPMKKMVNAQAESALQANMTHKRATLSLQMLRRRHHRVSATPRPLMMLSVPLTLAEQHAAAHLQRDAQK